MRSVVTGEESDHLSFDKERFPESSYREPAGFRDQQEGPEIGFFLPWGQSCWDLMPPKTRHCPQDGPTLYS